MSMENIIYGSTASMPSISMAPLSSRLVASITFFIMGTAAAFIYSLIFAAIVRNRTDFSSAFYAFLINIGTAEMIISLYEGWFGSICTLLGYVPISYSANCWFSLFTNCLAYGVQMTMYPVIAIDRLLAICFFDFYQYTYQESKTVRIGLILLAWLVGFLFIIPFCEGKATIFFSSSEWTDDYDWTLPMSAFIANAYSYYVYACICFCVLLYFTCILHLIYRRKHSISSVGTDAQSRAQRSLLLQGSLHFTLIIVDTITWNCLALVGSGIWFNYVNQITYLGIPLSNTVLTLGLNGAIRENIRGFFVKSQPSIVNKSIAVTKATARSNQIGSNIEIC